jgi:hypothetical protein
MTRNSIAYLGLALASMLIPGMAGNLTGQAMPAPPAKTITDYVSCVNDTLMKKNQNDPVSIADTVSCLPPKCSVIVNQSFRSDQPAGIKDLAGSGKVFPRVIFTCPGSKDDLRLRISYTLGPSSFTRLEIAQDVKKVAGINANVMIMANVPIQGPAPVGAPTPNPTVDKGAFVKIVDNMVKNQPSKDSTSGTQGCNGCHFGVGSGPNNSGNETIGKNPEFLLSQQIDPTGTNVMWNGGSDNLAAYVLSSNVADLKKTLSCDTLKANNAKLPELFQVPAADLNVILALCRNLAAYQP